jgi:hypothetical protein
MTVLYEDPRSGCEECGQAVSGPSVVRQGVHYLVWHPPCAAVVGPALLMDSREATLAADPEPRWHRRAVAAVRHRLQVEERSAA